MRTTIAIAGGGTGGHVFPALAVAEALTALADVEVVFFGTDRGLEARVVPARGFRLERLQVEPMRGGGPRRMMRGGLAAARASLASFSRVRRLRPRAVLSVGGYAAGPVSLAAAALCVPVAVLEPNSVVGLANRLLGPLAARAYIAWEEVGGAFRRRAVRAFGVPLRAGFAPRPYVSGSGARVLVMGGSQGAAVLNERMPKALTRLLRRFPALEVVHQVGRDGDAAVRHAYAAAPFDRAVVIPFIDDVARAIADADVVVARAGAATIAEITSIGRASILVPYPHAAGDHQARNAGALARRGAAVALEQDRATPDALTETLAVLLGDDEKRRTMAEAARNLGRPDAARAVASDLLRLAAGEA